MSLESLPSRVNITDVATGLEHALARIVASLRADCQREVAACEAERRAARAMLDIVLEQFKTAQQEYQHWLEDIKKQRVELRGEKGEPGNPGDPGSSGEPGAPGKEGTAGRDGRDGLPGVPGERGRDGLDGKDGKDGLGVSDFDVVYDGERKVTLRWANGDRQIERSFNLANLLYRGVWESNRWYEAQDVVTYAGAGFVAVCRTKNKPEGDDWQLFVKRGGNGTNGKTGERGPVGPAGRDGRDATQLGPHGGKW